MNPNDINKRPDIGAVHYVPGNELDPLSSRGELPNDATKNLFAAPWHVFSSPDDEITVIENESGRVLAELDDVKTANRLARLPELYDALMDAANRLCGEPKIRGEYACESCVVKNSCQVRKWYELLEKVREGE